MSSSLPVITSSLTASYTLPFFISTFVGAFCIMSSFSINCVFTSSTMSTKGFAIFSLVILTFFPPISFRMLKASTTSLRFPSYGGDTSMISLLVVIANLLLFFFFTGKITLTSTIIFSFLLWVIFLVRIDYSFFGSHCFKK